MFYIDGYAMYDRKSQGYDLLECIHIIYDNSFIFMMLFIGMQVKR